MGKVIIGMTMSLDGFVEDEHGSVERLYPDFEEMHNSEAMIAAVRDTGAVVMGQRAFAMASDPDFYVDGYEFQVPIFVLTHTPPAKKPKESDRLTFTFVTGGVESAVRQAKAAANGKDVQVIGGASVIQQCIQLGLYDEIQIDVMPVLLGKGLRLFENLGDTPISLEKVKIMEWGERTTLAFRPAARAQEGHG